MHTTSRHRVLGTVAGVIIGSALLAGCTTQPTDDPTTSAPTRTATATPTPTPTPTGVAAPATDEDAQAAAEKTLQAETAAFDEVLKNQGKGVEVVKRYAVGPELERLQQGAKAAQLDKTTREGHRVVTVLSGYSAPLDANGKTIDHGSVTLTVCNDISKLKDLKADGSPAPRPTWNENKLEVDLVYSPVERAWFVRNSQQVATSC